MPHLIVIYGAPFTGKSTVARALAASLEDKTALLGVDDLVRTAIVVPDEDAYAELEMAHTQARLLVANYLKNRYNVVIEGAFFYERDGALHRHEQEIDQTVALMRNLAHSPLLVRTLAPEDALRLRAEEAGRMNEIESALRINGEYKPRYGRWLEIDTSSTTLEEAVETILRRLDAYNVA